MKLERREIAIRLLAPTFLGGADQSGVWRTPPFKALLREWWRIAAAPQHGYSHQQLREREGLLFGNAWLEEQNHRSRFCQSKIRLSLAHWQAGIRQWPQQDPKLFHPEVQRKVGSFLYLGYGPLDRQAGTTVLKRNTALQANESNTLSLAWPKTEALIPQVLQLIDWFGTIGGRSRNGWGSLELGLEPLRPDHPQLAAVLRPLNACLALDWPHAIGQDAQGPLIWHSNEHFPDWKEAMTFLAKIKIGFRTHLRFNGRGPHQEAQKRHLLAYPVTNHAIDGLGGQARFANQLRFKLFAEGNGLRARIYHTPHACPLNMGHIDQLTVWEDIHAWLDQNSNLQRLGASHE